MKTGFTAAILGIAWLATIITGCNGTTPSELPADSTQPAGTAAPTFEWPTSMHITASSTSAMGTGRWSGTTLPHGQRSLQPALSDRGGAPLTDGRREPVGASARAAAIVGLGFPTSVMKALQAGEGEGSTHQSHTP